MPSLSDFRYELPAALIAARPAPERDGSRLMVVERKSGRIAHHVFRDLPDLLTRNDLLVFNDTRVVKARVLARKPSGGQVELLFHGGPLPVDGARGEFAWRAQALTKSSKPIRPGTTLIPCVWREGTKAPPLTVLDVERAGAAIVAAPAPAPPLFDYLAQAGHVPLPPYIRRGTEGPDAEDTERYQTVYARREGAVAAPTAGLHFTPAVLARLATADVTHTALTLHVGPGTFLPVRDDDYTRHVMPSEWFEVSPECAAAVARHRPPAGRVVAVGTTAVRTLEWLAREEGHVRAGRGETSLFITPGFPFRVVDALVTNFHLPESTLLLLVSAFAGVDLIREAYRVAVAERYRFYSYGDAMLVV